MEKPLFLPLMQPTALPFVKNFKSAVFDAIIFIVLIVLLLFGGKKIPELMRGLGKGVKSFKEGMNGIEEDVKNEKHDEDGK